MNAQLRLDAQEAAAESPAVWGLSLMATPSIPDRGARVQPRRAFSGRAGF